MPRSRSPTARCPGRSSISGGPSDSGHARSFRQKLRNPSRAAAIERVVSLYGMDDQTGVRRGDMVTLGKQHVKDGWLRFVPRKTRYKRVRMSEKPWLSCLAEIVAQSPCGDMTFLVTEFGKPFTAAGFGNWFRTQCDKAGLPQCSAHGLRKAGATLAAELGATTNQLMPIFAWDTPSQAKIYADAADRKRLAKEAMPMLARTPKTGA